MKILNIIFLCVPFILFSQENIEGTIFEINSNNKKTPLSGVNIHWENTSIGAITNFDGEFTIAYKKENTNLIISYVGFKTDTLIIQSPQKITHVLSPSNELDEIVLETRKKTTAVSYLQSLNIMNMSSDELLKSACCNLCESFETNPSIDVNFADALTGTRQIKMLGLTSPYILIGIESIPSIRGAAQAFGLSFVPGTWVESIQITKGAGSVIYGYESIAGQINAKLQKPLSDSKLFINAFGSANGRYEINTHVNTKVTDKLSTGLYVHGNMRDKKFDKNHDTFLDAPLMKQINLMNRWQYVDLEKGFVSFLNVRYLNDEKQMGQINFNPSTDKLTTNNWGSEIDTRRAEVSGKFSYSNPELTYQTYDVQVAYSHHNQESYFGQNVYNIVHNSFYSTAIYGSIIGDTRHKFKTGVNYTFDNYNETVGVKLIENNYERRENSIGAFFEYNFDDLDKFNLTAGLRIDAHNVLGTFITPRLHMRYTPWEKSAIKASVGRGKRGANIFAENQNIFATSRNIQVLNTNGEIYGLDPEIAWNYGVSFLQGFNLFNKNADVAVDFYRTNFINQVVLDMENPLEANFYNLEGDSYANNVQVEFNYNVFKGVDLRLAYKYFDVKTQYISGKLEKPLTPKQRLFANVSYETLKLNENDSQWKFDFTYNWLGKQRFTNTSSSPLQYQLPAYSPAVGTVNLQVTKVFSSKFEMYAGGENIMDIKQENPIVSAEDPFGPYFDTTMVYGPIFGSSYYAGLRYRIN
ncbi:carboxypeptidase-like regulatory domain-containing protein [Lutibacter holmesii]|uniref:Carboxypeptidase-like regulatory domain-containing protein n=1 Tax=Lutibacter holmesii TaxID=1137985 RepID=A0ABW3WQ41_9FLAO